MCWRNGENMCQPDQHNMKGSIQINDSALARLHKSLDDLDSYAWQHAIYKSQIENPWFTKNNIYQAIHAISNYMLDPELVVSWLAKYIPQTSTETKTIGLVLAGNIPLVGFQDVLCTIGSGNIAQIKLSEKDKYLIPVLLESWATFDPSIQKRYEIVSKLKDFDAIIATGSNHSARYFKKYFSKYPHIIRKNRNGIAVLTGEETEQEMTALGRDIFDYFGLGCRNVSKMFVPRGYDFEPLLHTFNQFDEVILHPKYKHNYDYNFAMFVINRMPYMTNGCVLLKEDASAASRIATVHYGYYDSLSDLETQLESIQNQIQCIICTDELLSMPTIRFGESQKPLLMEYADGIDTMKFLYSL